MPGAAGAIGRRDAAQGPPRWYQCEGGLPEEERSSWRQGQEKGRPWIMRQEACKGTGKGSPCRPPPRAAAAGSTAFGGLLAPREPWEGEHCPVA